MALLLLHADCAAWMPPWTYCHCTAMESKVKVSGPTTFRGKSKNSRHCHLTLRRSRNYWNQQWYVVQQYLISLTFTIWFFSGETKCICILFCEDIHFKLNICCFIKLSLEITCLIKVLDCIKYIVTQILNGDVFYIQILGYNCFSWIEPSSDPYLLQKPRPPPA